MVTWTKLSYARLTPDEPLPQRLQAADPRAVDRLPQCRLHGWPQCLHESEIRIFHGSTHSRLRGLGFVVRALGSGVRAPKQWNNRTRHGRWDSL
jgi:hypothetical protein